MFLEEKITDAAKFVDSLLRILKTEQENDKILFPNEFALYCSTKLFSSTDIATYFRPLNA